MTRFGVDNEKYTCVYGVDHALGRFFQIWRAKPARLEEDVPLVDIDEVGGVSLNWSEDHGEDLSPEGYRDSVRALVEAHLGAETWALITRIERNFEQSDHPYRARLEVDDVLGVLRAMAFSEPILALVRDGLA
jgi:hypothetical protein